MQDHARTRITSTVEHHTVFRNRNGRNRQTVSSRWLSRTTRSTSVHSAEVAQLTISMAQRHSWLPTVFVVLWLESPISHSSGSNHASQSSPSPPWLRPEFSLDLTRHANACFCHSPRRSGICLSNDVRRSDQRVDRHQLELFLAIRFLYPQLFDR